MVSLHVTSTYLAAMRRMELMLWLCIILALPCYSTGPIRPTDTCTEVQLTTANDDILSLITQAAVVEKYNELPWDYLYTVDSVIGSSKEVKDEKANTYLYRIWAQLEPIACPKQACEEAKAQKCFSLECGKKKPTALPTTKKRKETASLSKEEKSEPLKEKENNAEHKGKSAKSKLESEKPKMEPVKLAKTRSKSKTEMLKPKVEAANPKDLHQSTTESAKKNNKSNEPPKSKMESAKKNKKSNDYEYPWVYPGYEEESSEDDSTPEEDHDSEPANDEIMDPEMMSNDEVEDEPQWHSPVGYPGRDTPNEEHTEDSVLTKKESDAQKKEVPHVKIPAEQLKTACFHVLKKATGKPGQETVSVILAIKNKEQCIELKVCKKHTTVPALTTHAKNKVVEDYPSNDDKHSNSVYSYEYESSSDEKDDEYNTGIHDEESNENDLNYGYKHTYYLYYK